MFNSMFGFLKKRQVPRFGFNMILVFSMLLMPISPSVLGQSGNLAGQETNSVILTASQAASDKEAQNCNQGHQCALRFNGKNQWVQLDQFRGFDTSSFTLETWFNWSDTGTPIPEGNNSLTGGIPFITIGDSEGNINLFFGLQASTGKLLAVFEGESSIAEPIDQEYSLTGNTQVISDGWHHAAATFDGQTFRLYLDGNLDAEQTFDTPILPQLVSSREVYIAAALPSTGNGLGFFKGVLDEVRVWEVARSQAEIQEGANLENVEDPNLIGYWNMNEGVGIELRDSSGKGKHTVAHNSPEWTDGPSMMLSINPSSESSLLSTSSPNGPALVSPSDGATGVSTSPVLKVNTSDPDAGTLAVTFYGRVGSTHRADFTVGILPDTQKYSTTHNGIFELQTQWIASQQSAQNIAFVGHLGDSVDDWNVPSQWGVVDAAMRTLEAAQIPYAIAPGNTDEDHYGVPPDTTFFNTYFPVSRFAGRPYYGGAYNGDNANSYQVFSASGLDFIVINFKYNLSTVPTLSSAVLAWARNLLQTYPNRRAIVITHNLMSTSNVFSNDGLNIYNALKDTPNLFLMMGGHLDTEGMRTDLGTDGHTIVSLRSDYQTRPNGGNGWLRLLRFSPETNKIYIKTYSPYLDQYETDANSQFTLDYNMNGASFEVLGTVNVASGSIASMSWPGLTSGSQYDWYVSINDGTSTTFGPIWSFTTADGGSSAPVVTSQPANLTVTAGQMATFSAAASGSPTPTIQWQVSTDGSNWGNVTGATSTTYSFTAQAGDNLKQYRAVFTNSAGSATTNAATLTVNTLPLVTLQPVSQAVNAGQTTAFTATASGSPTPTVQWQVSTNGTTWSNITGATSNTYAFTAQASDNGNQYRAVFINIAGSDTTSAALLTVYSLPMITLQPVNQTVTAGQTATFTSAASGNPTPTVQWQVSSNGTSWANISGATSGTYSITASSGDNGKQYRAVFTNSVGPANSAAALLTVNTGPVITLQPANLTVNAGQTASFSASASGTPAPTVQWQLSTDGSNWNNIAGATSTSYSFGATSADNGKQFRAVFTNTAGSATTNVATLTVYSAPSITTQPIKQTVNAGQSVSFTAAASGFPTPTVQWQVTSDGILWTDISGAITTTYSFIAQSADHRNQIRAVFTNPVGSATTLGAFLYVNTLPVVTTQPSSQAVNAGQTATFTATAIGVPSPSVQWQVSSDGSTWANIPGATSTTYSFTAQAGDDNHQYRARFTNDAGSTTSNSAFLTVYTAPVIISQPVNQSVIAGQMASFSTAATGNPTPTVQWQSSPDGFAWTDITGATSTDYSFSAQLTDNGKRYRAVFTNVAGSAASAAALLTVSTGATAPVITAHPADQTVNAGQTASFTASASGNPSPTVKWQVSSNGTTWSDISGATSPTYSFTAQFIDNGKLYKAVFTNSAGIATTNSAHLTVYTAPTINTQPVNLTLTAGQLASFTAAAGGSPTPTVQWQVSSDGSTWNDITGATTGTYSFTAQATDNGKQYRAVFTNVAGSATTNTAILTVNTPPNVTTQPSNQTVNSGQSVSFTAAANGNPTPTVQWQVSTNGTTWNPITGATTAIYTFTAQAADNGKLYRAVFTNVAGSATTTSALLTVYTPPAVTTQPGNQTVIAGQSVTFAAAASGYPPPTVQWQVSINVGGSWTDITNATATTYSLSTQASDNGKQFRAVFTNVAGSASTNAAMLTVNYAPAITTQPSNQTVSEGSIVSFLSASTGSPTPTVQWQVSPDGSAWSNITGATSTTYSFTVQATDNGKQYRAVFTNLVGSATSNAAILIVNSDSIFTDNYNLCNASAWTGGVVNPTRIVFNTASGRNSTCGMAVSLTSSAAYVVDPSPNAEAQLRARFYFNPNTLTLARSDVITVYDAYNTSGQATMTIQIRPSGSAFQIRAGAMRASRKWSYTGWVVLSKSWHSIEFNWIAATAAGANNGSLVLWLDGVQSATLSGIDNDLQRIDKVALGIVEGMDGTTLGTYFFDDYISRRTNYIGQ